MRINKEMVLKVQLFKWHEKKLHTSKMHRISSTNVKTVIALSIQILKRSEKKPKARNNTITIINSKNVIKIPISDE